MTVVLILPMNVRNSQNTRTMTLPSVFFALRNESHLVIDKRWVTFVIRSLFYQPINRWISVLSCKYTRTHVSTPVPVAPVVLYSRNILWLQPREDIIIQTVGAKDCVLSSTIVWFVFRFISNFSGVSLPVNYYITRCMLSSEIIKIVLIRWRTQITVQVTQ